MTLVLNRIDDRLIHGQVVVGWGQPLDVHFIVLVDDAVAAWLPSILTSDWAGERAETTWKSEASSGRIDPAGATCALLVGQLSLVSQDQSKIPRSQR